MIYAKDGPVTVRSMEPSDITSLEAGFLKQGWHKPAAQFEGYFKEQESGLRQVFVAEWEGEVAGYTTLLPCAKTGPFAGKNIPEISDFNVLMKFQRRGVGSCILDAAECTAAKGCDVVSLGVGLHTGYGAAQRLYVKRGYIPDGSGIWYKDHPLEPYTACVNDDDLVLYFSKRLDLRSL
jgi:GNAT superfamily N-acetyltransferase